MLIFKVGKGMDESPLHRAVNEYDLDGVNSIIDNGTDINLRDEYGNTPLHIALWGKKFEVAELLVEKGADVNLTDKWGHPPLHSAVAIDSLNLVKSIYEHGAHIDVRDEQEDTPLHVAITNQNWKIAKFLISKGADVTLKCRWGWNSLYKAVKKSNFDIVNAIIDQGPGIDVQDTDGNTLLLYAIRISRWEMAQYLISKGADVTISDKQGQTALHEAILRLVSVTGQMEETQMVETIHSLMEHGADVDKQNLDGNTPLHLAAKTYCKQLIRVLLDWGASAEIKNNKGQTPVKYSNYVTQFVFHYHSIKILSISKYLKEKDAPSVCQQFEKDCINELQKIDKTNHIVRSAFHDLLKSHHLSFVNIHTLEKEINSRKEELPIYHLFLCYKLFKAKQRVAMLKKVHSYYSVDTLHENVRWRVISFLSDSNLKYIIETLK